MTNATAVPESLGFAGRPRGVRAQAARRFVKQPVGVIALLLVLSIFIVGGLAHVIAPQGWNMINLSASALHRSPSLAHPFGTDEIGRDVGVRAIYAIRTTEEVALGGAVIATFLGVLVGAVAGFYGGWLDALLSRLGDLVTAYPAVLLTLAALVYLGEAYPHNLILIYGGYMWVFVARVVRADIATLRTHDFVEAARAGGASDARILRRHLLPNAAGTILIAATALVGQIVLIDATVEFFGYGLPAAVSPSLGNLIADAIQQGPTGAPGATGWWIWIFPCVVLALVIVCMNLLGDALDAALNPSQRSRGN